MNGIGTFGPVAANVKEFPRTLEERIAQRVADLARNNAGAWSNASWEIDDALQQVRRARAEGKPADEGAALRHLKAVERHVNVWIDRVPSVATRPLTYRRYADTLQGRGK